MKNENRTLIRCAEELKFAYLYDRFFSCEDVSIPKWLCFRPTRTLGLVFIHILYPYLGVFIYINENRLTNFLSRRSCRLTFIFFGSLFATDFDSLTVTKWIPYLSMGKIRFIFING